MKIKVFSFIFLLSLAITPAQAGLLRQFSQLQKVVPMTMELTGKYHLSAEQKQLIRSILVAELPEAGIYIMELIANRQQLLDLSSANNDDDFLIRQLAHSQGELISELIIWKEALKKQLRNVLAEDQQAFIDEFISGIISLSAPSIVEKNHFNLK